MRVPLGYLHVTNEDRARVDQVLRSERLTYGPFTREFETHFAAWQGVRHAAFCASGTCALHVALEALKELRGWRPGDQVVVPALTFVASVNAVLISGLRPIFCDVDPKTGNMSPESLEEVLGHVPGIKAVMPVHLFGQPCDMDPILDLCRKTETTIVEDSCETMLAVYKGRLTGGFGDAAAFSTYMAHPLTTGVGGFMTSNDDEIDLVARSLIQHGRDTSYLSIDDGASDSEIALRRFRFERVGFSYRITEMEAALGLGQMERLPKATTTRRKNAGRLTKLLRPIEDRIELPTIMPNREHSFLMYPIICREEGIRDVLMLHLEWNGIETRPLLPLLSQPIYRNLFPEAEGRYPVAARMARNGLYFGCHPDLSEEDLIHVANTVKGFFDGTQILYEERARRSSDRTGSQDT